MELVIRGEEVAVNSYKVDLIIDGHRFTRSIRDPFAADKDGNEKLLEWYFEEWLKYPMLQTARAEKARQKIFDYGKDLFRQLFLPAKPEKGGRADNDDKDDETSRFIYIAYSKFRDKASTNPDAVIKISGSSAFHALHWEFMHDPDRNRPIALDLSLIRTEFSGGAVRAESEGSGAAVRVLLVTARPGGRQDVGYRVVSRPLLETLSRASVRAQVELLRPGTYKALEDQLEAHRHRPYHIVHFDLHGSLIKYDDLISGPIKAENLCLMERYGRPELKPFSGSLAFLAFEGDQPNKSIVDYVAAPEIAALMQRYRVPVVLLNSCQSGKQVGDIETSLAEGLVRAGVQSAVGMQYSVTVTGATKFIPKLYQSLFEGNSVEDAVRFARQSLYNEKERKAYFGRTVALEDWGLPVVCERGPTPTRIKLTTSDEEERGWLKRQHLEPPMTATGSFVGRDIEILEIERALNNWNMLLIQGSGGTGKTSLLKYLAFWWQSTEWITRSVYFGFDQSPLTLPHVLNRVGEIIFSGRDHAEFQSYSLHEQENKLAEVLVRGRTPSSAEGQAGPATIDRLERVLLILDNLETATNQTLATRNYVPPEELDRIRRFLTRLVGGRCLVLLGSRSDVRWLGPGVIDGHAIRLKGLDEQAAGELADRILSRGGISQVKLDYSQLTKLLGVLGGHPLSLEVVLPNLRTRTPEAILKELEKGDSRADSKSRRRTENITANISYSFGCLPEASQNLLLCLAPFKVRVLQSSLDRYFLHLASEQTLSFLDFDRWKDVLYDAEDLGLLWTSEMSEQVVYYELQPMLFYFLSGKLAAKGSHMEAAIYNAFLKITDEIANYTVGSLSDNVAHNRNDAKKLLVSEFDNFETAVEKGLHLSKSITSSFQAISTYFTMQEKYNESVAFSAKVLSLRNASPRDESSFDVDLLCVLDELARSQLALNDLDAATNTNNDIINIISKLNIKENDIKEKMTANQYYLNGQIFLRQRELSLASENFMKARDVFYRVKDPQGVADCDSGLGAVYFEELSFEDAEKCFVAACEVYRNSLLKLREAHCLGQIGNVQFECGRFVKAKETYSSALKLFEQYDDMRGVPLIYNSLGRVALRLDDAETAENYFRDALALILNQSGDEERTALYHHQLGSVAEYKGETEEALRNYIKAADQFNQNKDFRSEAMARMSYHRLLARTM